MNVSVKVSVAVFAQLDAQVMLVITSATINITISLVFDSSLGHFTVFDPAQFGHHTAIHLKLAVLTL